MFSFSFIQLFSDVSKVLKITYITRKLFSFKLFTLSFFNFIAKFINMLVMFLPVKAFILLSSNANNKDIIIVEGYLGDYGYVAMILSVTIILYGLNIVLHLYTGRLLNRQKHKFEKREYKVNDIILTKRFLIATHRKMIELLADIILIFTSFILFVFLSIEFSLLFLVIVSLYIIYIRQAIYNKNGSKVLDLFKLDESQFLIISNSIFYLSLFLSTFMVFIYFGMNVTSGIFILLLCRLNSNSIKRLMINFNLICDNIDRLTRNE